MMRGGTEGRGCAGVQKVLRAQRWCVARSALELIRTGSHVRVELLHLYACFGFGGVGGWGLGGGGGGFLQDFSQASLSAMPPTDGTHWDELPLPPHFQPCWHLSVWNCTVQSKLSWRLTHWGPTDVG